MSGQTPDWCVTHDKPWGGHYADSTAACQLGMRPNRFVSGGPVGSTHVIRYPVDLERHPTQTDAYFFVHERWPWATDPKSRALKLGEEAGEVQGAVIKMSEGRKDLDDLRQETAQLVLCTMALAESCGFDLWEAVAEEYERATS